MKRVLLPLLFLAAASGLHANVLIDPGFSSPFGATWSTNGNWGGAGFTTGTGFAAGGTSTQIYNDGWMTYSDDSSGTNPRWTVSGGVASRTGNTEFQLGGFGQMVTNPANGQFDNGDIVTFSFDYVFNGAASGAVLAGSLYGITAPNGTNAGWNLSSGEAITGLGQSSSVTIGSNYTTGTDYQFYLLNTFTDSTPSASSASYTSGNITLTRQYSLFAVVFQAEPNGTGGGTIWVDNASFAAIPEPSTVLLLLGAVGGAILLRRRRTSC